MRMHLRLAALTIVAGTAVTGSTAARAASVSYVGGTYSQDFDGLPTDITNAVQTITGKGPHDFSAVTDAAKSLVGWQLANPSGSSSNTEFRSQNGSKAGGEGRCVLSLGDNGDSERALGALATSNQISTFGVAIKNDTGLTLAGFTLDYIGEQWRRGNVAAPNALTFWYGIGSDIGASLTALPALDFIAPNTQASPTEVALDGNDPGNQSSLSKNVLINWLPGETLVLRWNVIDQSGQDDGLGIDSLSFSAIPEPSSSTLAALGMMGAAGFFIRRRRAAV